MTWRSLWLRKMRRDLKRSLAYVLPAALGVAFFLILHSFVLGLEAGQGGFRGWFPGREFARRAFMLTMVLVVFFSVFFIAYFHRLYVQGEARALGLLATFGLGLKERRRLVRLESFGLGAAAYVLGIGAAFLLGPFLARLTALLLDLGREFAFHLPGKALKDSLFLFGIVFLLEAFYTSWWVGRRWPKQLFAEARRVEAIARPSAWGALGGVIALLGGYALAVYAHPWISAQSLYAPNLVEIMRWQRAWFFAAAGIVVLVLLGTYLLLRDGLRFWLSWHRPRPKGRGPVPDAVSLLAAARLGAGLRRTAGVETVLAGIFAVLFTLVAGVSFTLERNRAEALRGYPVPLQVSVGNGTRPVSAFPEAEAAVRETTAALLERFEQAGFSVTDVVPFFVLEATVPQSAVFPLASGGEAGDDRYLFERLRKLEVVPWSAYEAIRLAYEKFPETRGAFPPIPKLTGDAAFFIAQGFEPEEFERLGKRREAVGFPWKTGRYGFFPGWNDPEEGFEGTPAATVGGGEAGAPAGKGDGKADRPAGGSGEVRFFLTGAGASRYYLLNATMSVTRLTRFTYGLLVVADDLWRSLPQEAYLGHEFLTVGKAIFFPGWENRNRVLPLLATGERQPFSYLWIDEKTGALMTSRTLLYHEVLLEKATWLYALVFLGFLFFTAGAFAVYMRLREREAGDLSQVRTLRSLGVDVRLVRRIWVREALVFYLLPIAFAVLHMVFAALDAQGSLRSARGLIGYALAASEGVAFPSLWESLRSVPPSVVRDLALWSGGFASLFLVYAVLAGTSYARELWRRVERERP